MAKAISINDRSGPKFDIVKTVSKQVLNYASLKDNSNKFYIIEIQEGKGDYPYRVYTEYGRMGQDPKREGRYFDDLASATKEFNSIIRSKERKEYKKIEVDESVDFSKTSVSVKKKISNPELSQINNKVLQFIGKLYHTATSYLVSNIDTPLGKLSASQVAQGIEILEKIEALLDGKNIDKVNYDKLSNEFYSIIPVIFGHRVDYNKFIIDDYFKLNDRKDLLGVMNSVVNVQNELEKTLEDKYKALNVKLKEVDHSSELYKRLVKFTEGTQSRVHSFGIKVLDVLEVENMYGHDKFNPNNLSTMELFHGSRNENILSILQNGLLIKPKSAVHTGSMFGSGIYTADQSTKSAQYCWGWGNNYGKQKDTNYLFICDVATGRMAEYPNAQPHLSKAPYGYDSVKGVKGSSLYHNEYIVYDTNQVKIRYVIEFEKI